MVELAQLVRAPGCGPGGRGFESLISPQNEKTHSLSVFFYVFMAFLLQICISPSTTEALISRVESSLIIISIILSSILDEMSRSAGRAPMPFFMLPAVITSTTSSL